MHRALCFCVLPFILVYSYARSTLLSLEDDSKNRIFFFQARLEAPAAAERKESKEQVPLLALSLSGDKFVFDLFTALFIRKLMLMINQNGSVMLGYWS